MFYKKEDSGYKEPAEGVKLKALTYGEKVLMAEFRTSKGSVLPPHSHPHEQIGYLVSGRIILEIDGRSASGGTRRQLVYRRRRAAHGRKRWKTRS